MIGLAVTTDGFPPGYEVLAGNRGDVTTVGETVTTMESRHGKADRSRVTDGAVVPAANVAFAKDGGRKHLLGTPKGRLRRSERERPARSGPEVPG